MMPVIEALQYSIPDAERTRNKCGSVYITVDSYYEDQLILNWINDCKPGEEKASVINLYDVDIRIMSTYEKYEEFKTEDHVDGSCRSTKTVSGWPTDSGKTNFPYWIVSRSANGSIIDIQTLRLYPTWMNDNREKLKSLQIGNMLLPGTHDSGCYSGYGLYKNFIYTQDYNIRKQLEAGIRYLDLRIGYYDSDNTFYINHDFVWIRKVEEVYSDIKEFLKRYPSEIIVIDYHRFPKPAKWSDELHMKFAKFTLEHLGDYAFEQKKSSMEYNQSLGPTLEEIWNDKKNIILAHSQVFKVRELKQMWGGVEQVWANTIEVDTLWEFTSRRVNAGNSIFSTFLAVMAILTPRTIDVVFSMNNLRLLASKVNPEVTKWVRDKWYDKVNIIATDYFLGNNLIDIAIDININK